MELIASSRRWLIRDILTTSSLRLNQDEQNRESNSSAKFVLLIPPSKYSALERGGIDPDRAAVD